MSCCRALTSMLEIIDDSSGKAVGLYSPDSLGRFLFYVDDSSTPTSPFRQRGPGRVQKPAVPRADTRHATTSPATPPLPRSLASASPSTGEETASSSCHPASAQSSHLPRAVAPPQQQEVRLPGQKLWRQQPSPKLEPQAAGPDPSAAKEVLSTGDEAAEAARSVIAANAKRAKVLVRGSGSPKQWAYAFRNASPQSKGRHGVIPGIDSPGASAAVQQAWPARMRQAVMGQEYRYHASPLYLRHRNRSTPQERVELPECKAIYQTKATACKVMPATPAPTAKVLNEASGTTGKLPPSIAAFFALVLTIECCWPTYSFS
jgi:hypothetical protein